MKLKLDPEGHVVVEDGKPVYEHADGKLVAFDAPATIATIGRLNGEAKGHREGKEAAEAKLKAFEGIEDPSAAKKALQTVANLKDKQLVDAGEVEKVKEEAIKAVEAKYAPVVAENAKLQSDLYSEKIGGSFSRSKFIADKIAIPADIVQSRFGRNFEIKDGKILAKDSSGNPIYSRAKPGEVADFDEALEQLVDQYPQKDSILKGSGNTGDGKQRNNGGSNGAKVMARSTFDQLGPGEKSAKMREGFTLTDN